MSATWTEVAADFHDRVKAACWDGLAGRLAVLHRPHTGDDDPDGAPRCRGCDRDRGDPGTDGPIWPCRTYTIVAATVLDEPDVEGELGLAFRARRARG